MGRAYNLNIGQPSEYLILIVGIHRKLVSFAVCDTRLSDQCTILADNAALDVDFAEMDYVESHVIQPRMGRLEFAMLLLPRLELVRFQGL